MLSPPSMVERLPPVASVLDSLRAALAPKPEDDHPRPWINPSPVDQFMASPGGEDHSITVQPLGDRILEEDEDAESDGPRNTSLPTPTQEDHVIASSVSSVSLSDAIPEKAAGPNVHDSIATLTPELADSDSIDAVLAIARARYSHDHPMADAPENEDTLVVDAGASKPEYLKSTC